MTVLDGAVVLVVGAGGGIGSRVSALLSDAGATVLRATRVPDSRVDSFAADLRQEGAAAELIAAAASAKGRLDGLVIAAGVVAFGPLSELADDTLDTLFAVNALAPARLVREAVPYLAASASAGREPFIVTLSGIVAESPTAGLAAYSASKAALAALAAASSRELRRSGIRMLDARPGHTETGLAARPIAGVAPAFPPGLHPDAVAARIVRAIADGERDLPSSAFTS
jgi:cyclic-di-GMP-binding biofilm dispersal mediator protein